MRWQRHFERVSCGVFLVFFFSSRRRHTRWTGDWSSDVCSSDLYGFHDAWTIGMFGPYVLAVWIGNFDGEGNPAFVGVQVAAPLFFQMVDAIEAQQPSLGEPVRSFPANLATVDVCAASGDLP